MYTYSLHIIMHESFVSFLFKTLHNSYKQFRFNSTLKHNYKCNIIYTYSYTNYSVKFETQKILIQNQNSLKRLNYFKRMDFLYYDLFCSSFLDSLIRNYLLTLLPSFTPV